jgi:hypothetical protein
MIALQTDDLGRDYPDLLAQMRQYSVLTEIREEKWYEARPFVLQLRNPRKCIVSRENFNEGLMWLDIATTLSGNFDHNLFRQISANAARHLDRDGAYGPRIGHQLPQIRDTLRSRPQTRRAVVHFSAPQDLKAKKPGGFPCTTAWQFIRRDGNLIMFNHMRANDVIWGLSYDVPTACSVGYALATDLGLHFAEYIHLSSVACLYARHTHVCGKSEPSPDLPELPQGLSLESSRFYARTTLQRLYEGDYTAPKAWWKRAMTLWKERLESR